MEEFHLSDFYFSKSVEKELQFTDPNQSLTKEETALIIKQNILLHRQVHELRDQIEDQRCSFNCSAQSLIEDIHSISWWFTCRTRRIIQEASNRIDMRSNFHRDLQQEVNNRHSTELSNLLDDFQKFNPGTEEKEANEGEKASK